MGWTTEELSPAEALIGDSERTLDDALASCHTNAVHIVEGIRGTKIARYALKRLVASGKRIGIISEGCDNRGLRGVARRALYTAHVWRLRGELDLVLAIGDAGVKWYSSCGVPRKRVFPFMYAAVTPTVSARAKKTVGDGIVRIVYVGQCTERKGISDLLAALNDVGDERVSLTVIGDGDQRAALETAVSRSLILRDRVEFTGAMPYCEAVASMSAFDVLVLPSHFDGWGVVVNEALMQGVPVVCSDMCGANVLLADPWRGRVFRSGRPESLAKELRLRVQAGPVSDEQRAQLKQWGRRLSGERLAEYFAEILAHVYSRGDRPSPPWLG